MKKYSILFVILAVVSLTCAAFAQEDDISKYLGVWYWDTSCNGEECWASFLSGYESKMELHSDFTATGTYHYLENYQNLFGVSDEDITTSGQWHADGDIAYIEAGGMKIKLEINEDGNLIAWYDNGTFAINTRDLRPEWGQGPVKDNAELEDFLGVWVVYATGNPKWVASVDTWSSETWQYVDDGKGTLNVGEDSIDVNIETQTLWYVNSIESIANGLLSFSNVPFEIKNGKLVGAFNGKNGKQPFEIEYHTLVLTVNPGKDNESITVFITQEDLKKTGL